MPFLTPDDVATLQEAIRAEADDLSQAMKNCMFANTIAAGDPIVQQWITMRTRVDAYLAQAPSWLHTAAQMDAGQQLQRDLAPWHARIAAKGCKDVPPAPSPPPAPGDLFGSLQNIGLLILAIMAFQEFRR